MELLQLVEDENYRRQRLNLDKVSGCKGREGGRGGGVGVVAAGGG